MLLLVSWSATRTAAAGAPEASSSRNPAKPSTAGGGVQAAYVGGWQAVPLHDLQDALTDAGYDDLPSGAIAHGFSLEVRSVSRWIVGLTGLWFSYGSLAAPGSAGTPLRATVGGWWLAGEVGVALVGEHAFVRVPKWAPEISPVALFGGHRLRVDVREVRRFDEALAARSRRTRVEKEGLLIGVALPIRFHIGTRAGLSLGIRPGFVHGFSGEWKYEDVATPGAPEQEFQGWHVLASIGAGIW